MHHKPAPSRAALWALTALVISSLACQTLLGQGGLALDEEDNDTLIHPVEIKPTQEVVVASSERLDGLSLLPDLILSPPGNSPSNRGRPEFSGRAYTLDTDHFRIHYTLDGEDGVPRQVTDASGHPDYVIEVARAMEYSWFASIDHFGWAPPPNDNSLGGDDRYDVYLLNILDENYAGYTDSDMGNSVIGDNPLTPQIELASTHTHIVLDNDYLEDYDYNDDGSFPEEALDYMRSTAAHEFHHAIQFGYDGEEPQDWVWEATSSWIEEELFDTVNDPISTLPSIFFSPDSCQLAEGGELSEVDIDRWYGMWILMRHLSEQYGHQSIVRLWEHIVDRDGYAAWDAMLAEYNLTLEDLYMDYSIALLTRNLEEGRRYPTVRLEGSAAFNEWYTPQDGVQQLGADYIYIPAQEPITVTLDGEGLLGVLVGIAEDRSYIYPMWNGELSIDASQLERTYLIVMNMQRASNARNCLFTDYYVYLASGGSSVEPEWSLPAVNFQAPRNP